MHIFIFSSRVSCRKIVTWKSWRNRFLPTPTFVQLSSVTIFKTSKKKVVFCDLINWNYFYVFKANRIAFSDKKKWSNFFNPNWNLWIHVLELSFEGNGRYETCIFCTVLLLFKPRLEDTGRKQSNVTDTIETVCLY